MIKKIIFLLALLLFVAPGQITAADTPPGLRFACLSVQNCRKGTPGSNNCSLESPHRVLLTPGVNKGFLNNPFTYITECLQVDENGDGVTESICTTGSAQLDHELFCDSDATCKNNNLSRLQNNPNVQYSLRNPGDGIYFFLNGKFVKQPGPVAVSTDANGNIVPPRIEWQSGTKVRTVRRFLIWNKIPPMPTPTNPGDPTPQLTGAIGGQQQGTLTFPFQNPATDAPPSSDCAGVAWDPYGRAFDTKTLEPISDAKILLKQLNPISNIFEEQYANEHNPNISNPDITTADGVFSFVVVDGSYTITPRHTSYTHAAGDAATLKTTSPNVDKIYSDFYFANSEQPEAIVQQGAIQHRDIPLEPSNGTGYRYPLSILDEYEVPVEKQLNGTVSAIQYGGTLSHPFADLSVSICSFATGGESCQKPTLFDQTNGGPDKNGVFSIRLDQTVLKPGEYFKKIFTAVDLNRKPLTTKRNWSSYLATFTELFSIKRVDAQEGRRSIEIVSHPLVTYLEGFAYSSGGTLLPQAKVMIYTKYSPQPVFTTTANTNGYFKITSEFIPRTAYTIHYSHPTDPNSETRLTTSQFLQQNNDFIEAEKINPFLMTNALKDPRKDITPSFVPLPAISPLPNTTATQTQGQPLPLTQLTPTTQESPESNPRVKKNNALFIIGSILLLISIAGAIGSYILLKRQTK